MATLVPFSSPCADADITRPPPQLAVNVPAIEFDVCVAIWYWKLPHVVALGSVGCVSWDVQTPTSEGDVPVGAPGVGFDADAPDELGATTLVACWNPQPAAASAAAMTTASGKPARRFMITNLS